VNALAYADEIRGKLTENESQRAEITGNINQLTIQLHRWQLRLQTLNERKQQLEKELGGKNL
jgi:chromosome segregation ATPase